MYIGIEPLLLSILLYCSLVKENCDEEISSNTNQKPATLV